MHATLNPDTLDERNVPYTFCMEKDNDVVAIELMILKFVHSCINVSAIHIAK